jgi:hypothetical protein
LHAAIQSATSVEHPTKNRRFTTPDLTRRRPSGNGSRASYIVSSLLFADEAKHDLEHDQGDDRRFEKPETALPRDVDDEPQGVLHAPELQLERQMTIDQLEVRSARRFAAYMPATHVV